jgi:putative FmdB family regulatory protein
MPIYGYRCDQCGHEFEVFQNMSDAPKTECPECGGRLRKQLYPVGVVFKGSGFYTTDYPSASRSENGAKPGAPSKVSEGKSSEGSSGGQGESKSESKSESKGESKSESKGDSKSESKPKSEGGSGSSSSSE